MMKLRMKTIIVWTNYMLMLVVAFALYMTCEKNYRHSLALSNIGDDDNEKKTVLWTCILYHAKGRILPPIKYNHEYERFLFSSFLHASRNHLALNLVFQWFVSKIVHDYYSVTELLFTSYYALVPANILAGTLQPTELSVGLSGVVHSYIGLLIVQSLTFILFVPNQSRRMKFQYAFYIGLSITIIRLSMGLSSDNVNHLVGLLVGISVGVIKFLGFKEELTESSMAKKFYRNSILFIKSSLIVVPLMALGWMFFVYERKEDEAAAIWNMGCGFTNEYTFEHHPQPIF